LGCGAGRERGMAAAGRSGGAAARERNGKTSGGGDVAQEHEDSRLDAEKTCSVQVRWR